VAFSISDIKVDSKILLRARRELQGIQVKKSELVSKRKLKVKSSGKNKADSAE
jgi:hypothetical protein